MQCCTDARTRQRVTDVNVSSAEHDCFKAVVFHSFMQTHHSLHAVIRVELHRYAIIIRTLWKRPSRAAAYVWRILGRLRAAGEFPMVHFTRMLRAADWTVEESFIVLFGA